MKAFNQPLLHKVIHYPTDRQQDAAATHTMVPGYMPRGQKPLLRTAKTHSKKKKCICRRNPPVLTRAASQAEIKSFMPEKRLAKRSSVTRTIAWLSGSSP